MTNESYITDKWGHTYNVSPEVQKALAEAMDYEAVKPYLTPLPSGFCDDYSKQ